MKGLEELQKVLDDLQKKVNEIAGGKFVGFHELLTDDFMKQNTSFTSMVEFFDQSPFDVKTQEDFDSISKEELDAYTKENTKYESFYELLQHAGTLYMKKELEKAGIKTN